jgi:2-keto-4-pentenoate hydratase/2-oxohepta-3-ene-1,7-dioic acid hydratase in catechol pathway
MNQYRSTRRQALASAGRRSRIGGVADETDARRVRKPEGMPVNARLKAFVGVENSTGTWIGRLGPDNSVALLCPLEEFWSDPYSWSERQEEPAARPGELPMAVPVPASARVICVGLNYRAHANEGVFSVGDYPALFGRWTASLSVGDIPASAPHNEDGLDWEGEVAVYIGREVAGADLEEAENAIFGYSTFNDLTARRAQKLTAQWTLGKNADRSGPLGPIVPHAEIGELTAAGLRVRTRVNGTVVQDGNTRDMVFSPAHVISLVSKTLTLHPGDVIATGTPEGVGYVRNPPWLLNAGDVVEVEIDRLGVLRTPIVSA